jgi:hypothetical protein
MHPALFYRPGERLSIAELSAARLDGVVVEVGEGFMPADTVEGADARATGLHALVPTHMAACGPTAAWIHGAGDAPPPIHHIRRTVPTRMRVGFSPRVQYHERRATPDEVQTIGGISVTTPHATALELLFSAVGPDGDESWLRALLLIRPELVGALQAFLAAAPRRPGRRRAVELMSEFGAVRTS